MTTHERNLESLVIRLARALKKTSSDPLAIDIADESLAYMSRYAQRVQDVIREAKCQRCGGSGVVQKDPFEVLPHCNQFKACPECQG
jgi:hypothetical protein